jgi:hypothetical protein
MTEGGGNDGISCLKTPGGKFEFVHSRTCDTELEALAYAKKRVEDWKKMGTSEKRKERADVGV